MKRRLPFGLGHRALRLGWRERSVAIRLLNKVRDIIFHRIQDRIPIACAHFTNVVNIGAVVLVDVATSIARTRKTGSGWRSTFTLVVAIPVDNLTGT